MPILDMKRTRFSIKFTDNEPTGAYQILVKYFASIGLPDEICVNIKSYTYNCSANVRNAQNLARLFKDKPEWEWLPTKKYINYVRAAYVKEKDLMELYNKVEAIKTLDPMTIGFLDENGNYNLDGYVFKTTPWNHQKIGFRLIRSIGSLMLTWDMRTGKTFMVSCALEDHILSKKVTKAVVLCPKGIMDSVWIRDVYQHTDLQGLSLSENTTKARMNTAKQKLITIPTKDGGFKNVKGTPHYYVFNHDAVRNKQVFEFIMDEVKPDCLIVDESHHFKTPAAKRTEAAMKVSTAVHERDGLVICMSGTPIAKDIRDIYSQAKMVDPAIFPFSFGAFKSRYCILSGGFNAKTREMRPEILRGTKNVAELKRRYEPRSFKVVIEDCHDMPEKHFTEQMIDMTQEQQEHHDSLLRDLITYVEKEPITATTLTKFMKLLQVSNGYIYDQDGNVHTFKKNPKIDALKDILEQILCVPERKVVIWSIYRPSVRIIRAALEEMGLGYAELTTQSKMDRNEAEYKFQNDPKIRVMLSSPALSEGKDFSKASYAIYYDHGYKFVDREQSERRVYTPQSKHHGTIVYTDLICRDSIEQMVIDSVRAKQEVNEMITAERLKLIFKRRR